MSLQILMRTMIWRMSEEREIRVTEGKKNIIKHSRIQSGAKMKFMYFVFRI